MKKVIPFKKEISFRTNVTEITSISLDNELNLENNTIKGNLVVSGSYKINDISINVEEFKYSLPIDIEMLDNYILDDIKIDIEDFYYEIINNNTLSVSIDVSIDNIKEVPIMEQLNETKEENLEDIEEYEEEVKHPIIIEEEITPVYREVTDLETDSKNIKNDRIEVSEVKSLFDNFDDSNETFSTYKICIVKEMDTVESIILKYGITKELLEEYNDISEIKIGDKLIIPSVNETIK